MSDPLSDRPLDPVFSPRSIAVIGASRRRDSIGFALLHNLVVNEFNGTIFPVNPHAQVIHSLKTYPRVGDIPDPIDLAIVMVPRDAVLDVVEECIQHGVKGLVVITAGFAEVGPVGAALETQLGERVRHAGVRMIGPNCMGVINTDESVRMEATFAPTPAERGTIGFVSQSGALGVAILNAAADLGIGLTQFVSMGNKTDVSGVVRQPETLYDHRQAGRPQETDPGSKVRAHRRGGPRSHESHRRDRWHRCHGVDLPQAMWRIAC
jgi:acyl-CoA synthetase (NDP forming)